MRQTRIHIASLMAGMVIFSCSEERGPERIAGNTTQTENTASARTILVDSILPVWNHPYWFPTVATLRLDSNNFDFSGTDSAGRDLAVLSEKGDSIPFDVVEWDKPARQGRLHVRIEKPLLVPGAKFVLHWFQPVHKRSDPVAVWREIPDSQRLFIGSVLVDDFEGPTMRSRLPDSTSWYKSLSDSFVTVSDPVHVAAGGGRKGTALRLAYKTPANTYKWALTGLALGSNGQPRNLRSLDSIVFWAKGSGTLSVAFDRLAPHKPEGKAWIHMELDTGWTRIRIQPSDLLGPDKLGENIGWDAVRDRVTNLTFLVSGGTNMYLDDIRLHGVDAEDLK